MSVVSGSLTVHSNEPETLGLLPSLPGASIAGPATSQITKLITDSHSPAQYRAVAVRNSDAWYSAFGVMPGQAPYLPPGERCRVW